MPVSLTVPVAEITEERVRIVVVVIFVGLTAADFFLGAIKLRASLVVRVFGGVIVGVFVVFFGSFRKVGVAGGNTEGTTLQRLGG
jgi:hypothetical protein